MTHVKICGVRSADDARACVDLGASAIGLNFVASSPRCVTTAEALAIARAVHEMAREAIVVGVVANMSVDAMRALVADAELDCLQLHGDEPPELLSALLPHAYKAVRVGSADDVARARAYPGEHLLVDAKVDGALGGTGATFDWSLVKALARERRLTLAGGLDPGNVARAVREIAPYCVDVASGVERAPGVKDLAKVEAFIEAARAG
ncbi:MAG: phosphoribosylanthranilate isomerase [Labilithrix sp.]|nr:phosphoribosylanthranilate isomerase [Labilithrix sp.]